MTEHLRDVIIALETTNKKINKNIKNEIIGIQTRKNKSGVFL